MTAKIDPFKIKRRGEYSPVSPVPQVPYVDLGLEQGTPEWRAARMQYVTASDVPAIMGASKYKKRAQVLEEKISGREAEVDDFKRRLFELGHLAEDAGRRYANENLGMSFKPLVLRSVALPCLLASLDGFDPLKETIFEAKYLGAKALEEVAKRKIKAHHALQVQAQLLVTGARRCMYFAMDPNGNAEAIAVYPDLKAMNEIRDHVQKFYAEWQKAKQNGKQDF